MSITSKLLTASPNQKNDPSRRQNRQFKADGSINGNDRVETGPTELAFKE